MSSPEPSADTAPPSPALTRRASAARLGTDSNPMLARKDSEIQRLKSRTSVLEEALAEKEAQLATTQRDDVTADRKIARAVDAATRAYDKERRVLQRLASRADFTLVELAESEARRSLEHDMVLEHTQLIEDAAAKAATMIEIVSATKPLRARITTLTFQLRVTKAVEQKNTERKLADELQKALALKAERDAARDELKSASEELELARQNLASWPSEVPAADTARIDDAEAAARASAAKLAEAETEMAVLKSRIAAAESELQAAQASVSESQDAQVAQQAKTEWLSAEVAAQATRIEELDAQLASSVSRDAAVAAQTEVAALRDENESLMEALQRSERTNAEAVQSRTAMASALDAFAELGDESRALSEDTLRAALDRLFAARQPSSLNDRSATTDPGVTDGVDDDDEDIAEVMVDRLRRLGGSVEANARADAAETALAEAIAQRDDAVANAARITTQRVQELESQLASLEAAHTRLESEADTRLNTANELMGRIDEMRTTAEAAEQEHREHLDAARRLQSEAEDESHAARIAAAGASRRVEQLNADLQQAQRQQEEAQNKLAEAEERAEKANASSSEQERNLRQEAEIAAREAATREEAALKRAAAAEGRVGDLESSLAAATSDAEGESVQRQRAQEALLTVTATRETEIASLKSDVAVLEKRVSELSTKLSASEELVSSVSSKYGTSSRDLSAANDTIVELTKELADARASATVDRETGAGKTTALEHQLVELQARCEALQRDVSESDERIANQRRRHETALQEERDAQEAQRTKYQTELLTLTANAQRLEMQCAERIKDVEASADDRVDNLEDELITSKARVAALEEELLDATAAGHSTEGTVAELREKNAALERAKEAVEHRSETRLQEAEKRIASLRVELTAAQREASDLSKKLRDNNAELETHKSNAAAQLVAVQRGHQRDKLIAEERLSAQEGKCRALESSAQRASDRNDALSGELASAQQRILELEAADEHIAAVTKDLEAALRRNATLQEKCEAIRAEKEAVQQSAREAMTNHAAATNEIQKLRLMADDRERRATELKGAIGAFESRVAALEGEVRAQEARAQSCDDARKREEAAHSMTRTELATTIAVTRTTEQALRDAEQMNVDLLSRVAEVENSLDDTRLAAQRESFSRMRIDASGVSGSWIGGDQTSGLLFSHADASPIRSASPRRGGEVDMFSSPQRGAPPTLQLAGFIEVREAELRGAIVDFASMFHALSRQFRSVLDDAAHSERLERQHRVAEQRRVRTLSDHVAALQAEASAMQQAWRNDRDGSIHEASMLLLLQESQSRRVIESSALEGVARAARDYLVKPLSVEARKVITARREVELERRAADDSVGRAVDGERRLTEALATIERLRGEMGAAKDAASAERDVIARRAAIESGNEALKAATQHCLVNVEADEAYCRWIIYDGGVSGGDTLRATMNQALGVFGVPRLGMLPSDDTTKLRRQVVMWKTRCHAVVELEKASLDAAIATAVRGHSASAPPRPAALVTLQTLEQSQRRLIQQLWFETQAVIVHMAGYC